MEAHEQYEALDENHRLAMEAESRRLAILEDEAETAAKHVNNIERTQEEMFGKSVAMCISVLSTKDVCLDIL